MDVIIFFPNCLTLQQNGVFRKTMRGWRPLTSILAFDQRGTSTTMLKSTWTYRRYWQSMRRMLSWISYSDKNLSERTSLLFLLAFLAGKPLSWCKKKKYIMYTLCKYKVAMDSTRENYEGYLFWLSYERDIMERRNVVAIRIFWRETIAQTTQSNNATKWHLLNMFTQTNAYT